MPGVLFMVPIRPRRGPSPLNANVPCVCFDQGRWVDLPGCMGEQDVDEHKQGAFIFVGQSQWLVWSAHGRAWFLQLQNRA